MSKTICNCISILNQSWVDDKYEFIIRLNDLFIFLAGVVVGMIIMSLLASNFLHKIKKIRDGNGSIKILRVDHGVESGYVTNFNSFWETLEEVLLLSFSPFFTQKTYTLRDKKRTKKFLIIMLLFSILIILLALSSVTRVDYPKDYNKIPPNPPVMSPPNNSTPTKPNNTTKNGL